MLTFGQRRVRRPAPAAVCVHNCGTDRLVIVVDGDGAARLALTGQFRLCIVGRITAAKRTRDVADVIGDSRCGRFLRRNGVNCDVIGRRRRAAVARRIGLHGIDAVRTVRQRHVRREAPPAVRVHHHGADRLVVVIDDHGVARLALAGNRRLRLVGRAAVIDDVARAVRDGRCNCARHHGVDGDQLGRRRRAAVARRIGLHGIDAVRTVRQRHVRREAPPAVRVHHHGADRLVVVIDDHGVARLALAGNRRLRLVGRAAVIDDVARAVRDGRCNCARHHGVDGDQLGRRRRAAVARRIGLHGIDAVRTVRQRHVRREAPPAVRVHHHGADRLVVVIDDHGVARLALAGNRRLRLVGRAAVIDDVARAVRNGRHSRLSGWRGIDNNRDSV